MDDSDTQTSCFKKRPFKPPRKLANIPIILSDDEAMGSDDTEESTIEDIDFEPWIRGESQKWLAEHGAKLFGLECSKWLAKHGQLPARQPLAEIKKPRR